MISKHFSKKKLEAWLASQHLQTELLMQKLAPEHTRVEALGLFIFRPYTGP